jgi:hydroxymethylpyrimidine/phosphomethylpyrimidine kinase
VIDYWFDARGMLELRHPRLPGQFHGTGCTLSAALAAELAKGTTPRSAARRAVAFVQRAMRGGFRTHPGSLVVLRVAPTR